MMTGAALAILLVIIGILIFCSALFSGLETALFSLKPHQLRGWQSIGLDSPNSSSSSRKTRGASEHPAFGRRPGERAAGDFVSGLLVGRPVCFTHSTVVTGIVIFAIVVLICDLIPKLLALSAPYGLSSIGAFTLQISMPLLDRVGHGLDRASTWIVDRLTPSHLRIRPRLSDDELRTLLEMGEEEGALQEEEAEMIEEIIKLGDKTAKDCMTPRVDSFTLPG